MYVCDQGSVSRKILSLEIDLSSLITMVTIVFSLLKFTRGLKIFEKLTPCSQIKSPSLMKLCSCCCEAGILLMY